VNVCQHARRQLGLTLVVAHVDHGIQSDSQTVRRPSLVSQRSTSCHSRLRSCSSGQRQRRQKRAERDMPGSVKCQKRRGAKYIVTAQS